MERATVAIGAILVSYEGHVERSVATLLKWAARDNDRTMLFAAELTIALE